MAVVPALLLAAAAPRQPAMTLGSVQFLDNEHPAELPIPLTSSQAVHPMIGGYREVQDLGPQPDQITWDGTFWDAQASSKAASIKKMQSDGKAVTLKWNDQAYSVLIEKFVPTFLYEWRIKYSITVTVVADLSGTAKAAPSASLDSQTQGLFVTAQSSSDALAALAKQGLVTAPDPLLATNLNTLGTQLSQASPLAQAIQNEIAQINLTIDAIDGILSPYIATLTTAMTALSGLIPSGLQQAYTHAIDLASSVNLIAQNVGNGQALKIVQVGGGMSLYHLAAQYYGDATLATVLRAANGLLSMSLPSGVTTTLKIPPATASPLA